MTRYSCLARYGLIAALVALAPIAASAEEYITILTAARRACTIRSAWPYRSSSATPSRHAPLGAVDQGVGREPQPSNPGKGELAFTLGNSLRDAWAGNRGRLQGAAHEAARLAAIYANYIQLAALKSSGIKTLADLKGKRMSVGAPKSGTELNARAILGAAA